MSQDRGRLLKPAEVCYWLSVSRSWLYSAAADGRIPSIRLGEPEGPVRFVQGDVEDWLVAARAAWSPGRAAHKGRPEPNGAGLER